MPGHNHHDKPDAIAASLYEFLKVHGVAVERIGRPLDALVSVDKATALTEVKGPTGKLTPGQERFLAWWPGLAMVLRSEADCLELIQKLRGKA